VADKTGFNSKELDSTGQPIPKKYTDNGDGTFSEAVGGVGTKADGAATTDAGTWSLISLVKRLLQKLTTQLPASLAAGGGLKVEGVAGGVAQPMSAGGYSDVISPTVTVSTSPAYSVGDLVGGKLTLSGIVRSPGTALLQSLFMIDTSNQKSALELIIFNSPAARPHQRGVIRRAPTHRRRARPGFSLQQR
jgi:hypothetical protein